MRCGQTCTDLGIPIAGQVEEKEDLKNLLKCGKFSFYVMVDRKIFTYLKNKKLLVLIVNKKFKIFDFQMEQYTMLWLMGPFGVTY